MKQNKKNTLIYILIMINSLEYIATVISLINKKLPFSIVCATLLSLNLLVLLLMTRNNSDTPQTRELMQHNNELILQAKSLKASLDEINDEKKALAEKLERLNEELRLRPALFHCPLTSSAPILLQDFFTEYLMKWHEDLTAERIIFSLPDNSDAPPVFFAPSALTLVCDNLFDNIMKFTPANGKVYLRLTSIDEDALIILHNSGTGVAEEDLTHIFELNYQGKNHLSGTGLGLTQAKAVIDSYGGQISAGITHSGFTIYIRLPQHRKGAFQ